MSHTLTELVMGSVPIVVEETRGFWEASLREHLTVQVCAACGNRQYPGGPCCARCWSAEVAWEPVSGRGRVFSFTVVRHALHPSFSQQIPYVVADIELEEGPVVTSNVTDVPAEEVRIGMPVEVWFDEQLEDAFHQPLRLPKFRPAKES